MAKRYNVQGDSIYIDEDQHIILNELASRFYSLHGYTQVEGFDYSKSSHPQEVLMYQMALEAMYFQQNTGELD